MNLPRNPFDENALRLQDVRPDLHFIAYKSGEVIMQGRFKGWTQEKDAEGWPNIDAVDEQDIPIRVIPYEVGLARRPNGQWEPEAFVKAA